MKYVTLQHPQKLAIVVAGCGLTHAELAAPYQAQGYTARNAGFFRLLERERFECFGFSESLKLHPHPDDARLLQAWHRSILATAPAGENPPGLPAEASPAVPAQADAQAGAAITTPTVPPIVLECQALRAELARVRRENRQFRAELAHLRHQVSDPPDL